MEGAPACLPAVRGGGSSLGTQKMANWPLLVVVLLLRGRSRRRKTMGTPATRASAVVFRAWEHLFGGRLKVNATHVQNKLRAKFGELRSGNGDPHQTAGPLEAYGFWTPPTSSVIEPSAMSTSNWCPFRTVISNGRLAIRPCHTSTFSSRSSW